jgi:hypothetical protein
MASIERTAHELEIFYCPTEEDFDFVYGRTDDPAQQLTLMARLKCHQHLGYLPTLDEIPASIRIYLCQQLHVPADTNWAPETQMSRHRHRLSIRAYLKVSSYSQGGERVVAHETVGGVREIGGLGAPPRVHQVRYAGGWPRPATCGEPSRRPRASQVSRCHPAPPYRAGDGRGGSTASFPSAWSAALAVIRGPGASSPPSPPGPSSVVSGALSSWRLRHRPLPRSAWSQDDSPGPLLEALVRTGCSGLSPGRGVSTRSDPVVPTALAGDQRPQGGADGGSSEPTRGGSRR